MNEKISNEKIRTDPNGQWGLWDTRDKCWIGQDSGPNRYAEHEVAQMAATIATEMAGHLIQGKLFESDQFKYKDSVDLRFDGAEALRRMESRTTMKEEFLRKLGEGGKSASDYTLRPICSICGEIYEDVGHNAWPVNEGRCCSECNRNVVLPKRAGAK